MWCLTVCYRHRKDVSTSPLCCVHKALNVPVLRSSSIGHSLILLVHIDGRMVSQSHVSHASSGARRLSCWTCTGQLTCSSSMRRLVSPRTNECVAGGGGVAGRVGVCVFGCAVVRKGGGVWGGGEVCACPQSASPRACMRVCLIAGSASVRCSVVGRSLSPSVSDSLHLCTSGAGSQ